MFSTITRVCPIPVLGLLLALLTVTHVKAASPVTLDTMMVHRLYAEGEFTTAISVLEDMVKNRHSNTQGDSLLLYKYLGVMYSADPKSREKGKAFLYKVYEMNPKEEILDLYASQVVLEMVQQIKKEICVRTPAYCRNADSLQANQQSATAQTVAATQPKTAITPNKSENVITPAPKTSATLYQKPAFWWSVGAVTTVTAVGTVAYLMSSGSDPKTTPSTQVDVQIQTP